MPSGKTSNQFARRKNKVKQDQILWVLVHSLTKNAQKRSKSQKSQFLQNFGIFLTFSAKISVKLLILKKTFTKVRFILADSKISIAYYF